MNGNGNWLARDIIYHHDTCRTCRGSGLIATPEHEMRAEIDTLFYRLKKRGKEKGSFRTLIAIYREWKRNDKCMPCPTCEGNGEIEWKE
jgi:DnaJ-class molecular chaperone